MPIRGLRGEKDAFSEYMRPTKFVTTRCYACDTFFEARTVEAARSLLESHQARENHQRDQSLNGVDGQ